MELTEKERLMLVGKIEEIRRVANEIIDMFKDDEIDIIELKKKIVNIQSRISILGSFSKPKNVNLEPLNTKLIPLLFKLLDTYKALLEIDAEHDPLAPILPQIKAIAKQTLRSSVELFCVTVNSIHFNLTKRGVKIKIPKIDFSIFRV